MLLQGQHVGSKARQCPSEGAPGVGAAPVPTSLQPCSGGKRVGAGTPRPSMAARVKLMRHHAAPDGQVANSQGGQFAGWCGGWVARGGQVARWPGGLLWAHRSGSACLRGLPPPTLAHTRRLAVAHLKVKHCSSAFRSWVLTSWAAVSAMRLASWSCWRAQSIFSARSE